MKKLWFSTALLPQGWAENVRISHDRGVISQVETGIACGADDERHAIGLPGLSNLHSHSFQRGMAGLAETAGPTGDSFWTWREVMYRFLDHLTPDDVEAIAAQAFVEMLEAGFTRVGEFHYLHKDASGAAYADLAELSGRIIAAAQDSGIGLTLLPVFYAHAHFGGQPPAAGQRRFILSLDDFARLMEEARRHLAAVEGARLGIAPHSLRAATPEEITTILPLAKGGPVHIHIAEQQKEVADCQAFCGLRPVQFLFQQVAVDAQWCLIHATHLTEDEVQLIAKSKAVVGLCPITEANLGDGLFPAPDFVRLGGRWGVGSDSNVLIDAAGELQTLEYGQRLILRARNVLSRGEGSSTGRSLFDAALAGGHQAMGVAVQGLEVGAPADCISLKADHPGLAGATNDRILDSWIFAGGKGMVDCVWRGGRQWVVDGRHLTRAAVQTRYATTMARLLRA